MQLEARFLRQRDRFEHQVIVVTPQGELPCLTSLEGNDQESFPPSPPLQDMSVERRVGSQVALGVGMAGSALWSLSALADAADGSLLFDWACQTRGAAVWPQNCYLWSSHDPAANSASTEVVLCRWRPLEGAEIQVVLTLLASPLTKPLSYSVGPAGRGMLPAGYTAASQELIPTTNSDFAVNDPGRGTVLSITGSSTTPDALATKSATLRWQYRIAIRQ